jgi:DNA (cytosine-5)-methyltransferase 3A
MINEHGLTVLSLFDGGGMGYEALKRAEIPVKRYYASEINPYAQKVSWKNHPDIIQLGDVKNWK